MWFLLTSKSKMNALPRFCWFAPESGMPRVLIRLLVPVPSSKGLFGLGCCGPPIREPLGLRTRVGWLETDFLFASLRVGEPEASLPNLRESWMVQ